ncbi:MAG: uroporphyrinogen-III C-methyltransferase [Actinomycetales bacterium]|nr:uroporphyrinogen-III C-methyltransferase [Actinomycetales bacterium]
MTTLLGIELAGRDVLVVGGGEIAARRVHTLLADHARVHVVAPELCAELEPLAESGAVTWTPGPVQAAHVEGVWFVHTATGNPATDAQVARWAEQWRVLCVNASDAAAGSARVPATAVVGDVLLGVVSVGAPDPRRSVAVRDALAGELRAGRVDLRRKRPGRGSVTLVGGGPGDPELLTLRGRRALAEADVVVTDRLGPVSVLDELPPDVEVIHVGKTSGHHPVPQREIERILVDHARQGRRVVRLKGGDPFLYGRGGEEVVACRAAGVPVDVVPGVTSALSGPLAAGIPVTHRGTVGAVLVTNGHDGLSASALAAVRDGEATLVVLMAVANLAEVTATLLAAGADPATPAAVIERATTPRQRVTRAPLADLAAQCAARGVRAPGVVVIGAVAAEALLDPTAFLDAAALSEVAS